MAILLIFCYFFQPLKAQYFVFSLGNPYIFTLSKLYTGIELA